MNSIQSNTLTTEATDALFDTSDAALAVRFGARARQLMRDGREPREAARLAFTYAARALQSRQVLAFGVTH